MATPRERLSLWIAVSCGLAIVAFETRIFLLDGSYFMDEASVVLSLDGMSVAEVFSGRLAGGGQNFPRFYLLLIRGVRALLGPETWATRLLPFLCFVGATALWMRLLRLRFGSRPELVLLGAVLLAMAPSWWTYGTVVKQYSLDTFLALALLTLPDRVFAEVLGPRRRVGPGLLLVAPILLSYVYPIALTARVTGWLAFRLRRGLRLDPVGAGAFLLLFVAFAGLLWLTDLRHTIGRPLLVQIWSNCILSQRPEDAVEILRRFFVSWYFGPAEFVFHPKLWMPALWLAVGALALGVVRVARSLIGRTDGAAGEAWGSRSASCLAGVVGVIATSLVLDYPICAGRLTLYALGFQQLLLLEGIDGSRAAAAGRPVALALVALAIGVLLVSGGWTAAEVLRRVAAVTPLEDVRPRLERIPDHSSETVVVSPCMGRQIRTLPEGLGEREVVYLPPQAWQPLLPEGREVWIVHSRLVPGLCEAIRQKLLSRTAGVDDPDQPRGGAVVYHTRVLTRAEREEKRAPKRRRDLRKHREKGGAPAKDAPGARPGPG